MTPRGKTSAYVELTKPRIVLLLLLVALAGYLVSAPRVDALALGVLLLGGALSSGGSSALNHFLDRDIDSLMARTRHRPLVTGALRPGEALGLGLVLVAVGTLLPLALINALTALFILLGAAFYVVVYTLLLKRRTVWNIVIGGFAGSCPALAGSAAAVGTVTLPALLIALLVFLWTPGHFWALSFRNRRDYRRAGIPMLPAVWGERPAAAAIIVSTLLVALFLPAFHFLGGTSLLVLVPALLAGAYLVYTTLRIPRLPGAAWSSFKFSGVFLLVTLLAVALGGALS